MRLAFGAEAFSLEGPRLVVGRSRSCDIRLRDDTVSRLHAALVWRGGTLVLEDLGSSNGTWVNGERVLTPRSVAAGDNVRFGSLKGVIEAGSVPAAAPPAVAASRAAVSGAAAATSSHTGGLVLGQPAPFGLRLAALLADVALLALGTALLAVPPALVFLGEQQRLIPPTLPGKVPTFGFFVGVCSILWLGFVFVYLVDGWARRGGSPGMRLFGLRLFDWRQRIPIGYLRAWLRLGGVLVTSLTLGVGFLTIVFRRDRRALHDLLAGTLVAVPPRRAGRQP